jgi:cation:H+ antiporter
VLGLGVLVVGARWLVAGAVDLAEALAIPSTIIGLTVVAIGTSLPELATSLVAAARGQSDLAIGNVIGSNLFNLLGILGVAALVRPLAAPGLSPIDLAVMTGLAAVLIPLAGSRSLNRIEGGLLLVAYAGYIGALALRG